MPPASASTGRPAASARRRRLRLDANDPDTAGIAGGDAPDQSAAADGHQQRVQPGQLLFELEADRALAEQRFPLIEGVD
jgi:hypothetical protein